MTPTPNYADITQLTAEVIDKLSTSQLRAYAAKHVPAWNHRHSIASLPITAPVAQHPGGFTLVDQTTQMLLAAFAADEPVVEQQYGRTIEIMIWNSDDNLRHSLKRALADAAMGREDDHERA